MDSVKEKLSNVKEVKLLEKNEDNTKKYKITAEEGIDLRKNIFEVFAKEGITIFEMKKADVTLEDAFMQLISKSPEEIKGEKEEKKNEEEKKGGKE